MKCRTTLVLFFAFPAALSAQLKTSSPVMGALVKKSIPLANITAATGSISVVPAYQGITCSSGCIVAKSGSDGQPGVSVHFADGSVRVEEVRTAVVISHDKPHSLAVTLNGKEIVGMQCDAHGTLVAAPRFQTLGASGTGFKWAIFQGSKMLTSSHSAGEPVKWNGDGHTMGPMQVAVFSDATVEITHGDSRLVMTSDDGAAIESRSGGSLRFEDLGLRVAGASEFGITSAQIQGVNK